MRCVAATKLLNFNLEKSGFLIFGSKRRRLEVENKLKTDPLVLCDKLMGQQHIAKYLGDYLSELGLSESIKLTVSKRKGLAARAMYEVKSILSDCRAHVTGCLVCGLDMWEVAIIPALLYNAETWQDIHKNTVDELETIQLKFLRSTLAVGTGCPIPLLYSETGTILMEYRILQKKLTFLHHIENLPDTALAKEVLSVQVDQGLPGIYNECKNFLAKFEIFDLKQYSKNSFKKLIKTKIFELNKEKLIDMAKSKRYKKINLDELEANNFKLKSYLRDFNMTDARLKFKLVSQMTPSVQMNFQSDKGFKENLWTCEGCRYLPGIGFRDTQQHILICPGYEKLRSGRDFSCDRDLVEYFRQVLLQRMSDS